MTLLNLKISKKVVAILLLIFVESAYAEQHRYETAAKAMSAEEAGGFSGVVIFNSVIPANQKIALGINPEGHLNTYNGNVAANASATGIAYKWHAHDDLEPTPGTWQDATSPGCLCEGWGVSGNGQQGWANVAKKRSGGSNLRVKSFETSTAHITSIVEMGPIGNEVLQVTHEYSPSPESRHTFFQGIVTITNISDKKVENVRYRREMDWDIPPTEFREYVSHFGVVDSLAAADKPKLLYACDNGFAHSKPLDSFCSRTPATFNTDFEHNGPSDHGSSFNFALPDLDCGESVSFMIYYGVATTRAKAFESIAAVGAEVYSFGASRDARDGVTFMFGFKGISGVRLPTDLPPKAVSLPNIARLQTFAPVLPYGDALYQSTFRYRKDKQWKGHITKYNLSETGKILAASKIDAGQLLASVPSANRNIWTATNGTLSFAKSNDNFTTANLSVLKAALYRDISPAPTDEKAQDLIQFVRGVDSYDENLDGNFTADRNWKLADTFHSNITIAPPPRDLDKSLSIKSRAQYKKTRAVTYESFVASNTSRETMIYVAANDGMLHAFNAATMIEKWAFVPPPLLDKLRGVFNEKGDGEAIKGKTNSIYLADGSITLRDIYYGGQWRSTLIAGLGYGGKGLYAIDVTDPSNPEHLFSIKHDNTKRLVEYWDADGTLTFYDYVGDASFPAALDYSKMGESWSRPFITLIPYDGALKWVTVIGAGYSGVDGKEAGFGRFVYVLDLEPNAAQGDKIGTVLAKIELTEYAGSDVPNAAVAAISALTVDSASNADYYGNLIYIADLQGSVWKFDLAKNELSDSDTTIFDVERHLNAESTLSNDRLMYHKPVVSFDGNTPQYFVGTGDMVRRDRLEGVINNRIFAFKDHDFPLHANADSTIPFTMSDLADASTSCATSEQKGWYQNLSSLLSPSLGAKVIGEAAMFSNSTDVYFSTYVPSSDMSCSAEGSSYLLTMDKSCGTETVAEIKIGDGLATTPVVYKGSIYIGIGNKDEDTDASIEGVPNIFERSLIDRTGTGVKTTFYSIKSWREIF